MALEIISEPVGSPCGSFTPYADQTQFRSAFGVVGGTGKAGGFIDGHTLQGGLVTADGRARIKFIEFTDKEGKTHDITFEGKTLREFVCDKADAESKDRYDGDLSTAKMQSYLAPVTIENSATQVGIQKSGTLAEAQAPLNHTY